MVEQIYSVVGVLEDLDSTFKALEAYIPKFFRTAKEIYDENTSNLTITQTNKNPNKKPIKNSTRIYLESRFDVEIEFYEFCKQRLQKQVKNLKTTLSQDDENQVWPDQLAENSIIQADDYVLL